MIVLHTTRYGDSSLIVHGYTPDSGRESFLLRGVSCTSGRPRRHTVSLLHPLSLLEVTVSDCPVGSLRHLKEFSPAARLDTIRNDIYKSGIAMFISEFLYRSLCESVPDPGMYRFITDAVLRLESMKSSAANFHIWFLIRFAQQSGFPLIKGFEMEYDPFDDIQRRHLFSLTALSFDEAMAYPMTGSSRKDLCQSLVSYTGYHLGIRPDIRSAAVLHAIFA